MRKINPVAKNWLQRNERTALVVVQVDFNGRPDSVSYWKTPGRLKTKHRQSAYKTGILMDIWA